MTDQSADSVADPRRTLFVDSHAHLDEPIFDDDRVGVLQRANASGVTRMVNIAYCPDRWRTSAELHETYPNISVAFGLHPTHARAFNKDSIQAVQRLLDHNDGVAVGEIGFDFYWPGFDANLQELAFVAQLTMAAELNLPVIIHQRSAESACAEILSRAPSNVPVVLHSFDGTWELGRPGIERGYYFGVGGLMTRATAGAVREVLSAVPLERLLLETDSPFLTPSRIKIRRNEPANIPVIARYLAELRGTTVEEIARYTTENALRVFNLDRHRTERPSSPIQR